MVIKYKVDMEESVDTLIRSYWLTKSSKRRLLVYLMIFPIAWFLLLYFKNFEIKNSLHVIVIFTISYSFYLFYFYGPWCRNKAKNIILEKTSNSDRTFECDINVENIHVKTADLEVNFYWKNVKYIRKYKEYIEIFGPGTHILVNRENSPPIEEISNIWDQHKELIK